MRRARRRRGVRPVRCVVRGVGGVALPALRCVNGVPDRRGVACVAPVVLVRCGDCCRGSGQVFPRTLRLRGSGRQTSKLKEHLELDQIGFSRFRRCSATANVYCNGTTSIFWGPKGPFKLKVFLDPRRRPFSDGPNPVCAAFYASYACDFPGAGQ